MRGNEMFYFPSYSLTSARPFGQGPQDLAALARTWAGLATFFGRVHDSQFDHDFEFLGYQTRFRPDQERDHPQSEGLKRDHGAFIVLGREMDPRAAGHKPQREAQLKSSLSDALVQNRASAKFLAAHRWQKKSMAEEVDAQLISWKPYARLAPPQRLSMATNVPTFRPSNDPARCAPNIAFCHDNRSQLNISHSCTQVLKPYRSDYKKDSAPNIYRLSVVEPVVLPSRRSASLARGFLYRAASRSPITRKTPAIRRSPACLELGNTPISCRPRIICPLLNILEDKFLALSLYYD
jgi:hypothetical protein